MKTILDTIADHARERVVRASEQRSLDEIRTAALELPGSDFVFETALRADDLAFICECKKASPSKGLIAPDFPHRTIARDYESAGAEAISVLTEPKWFLGRDEYMVYEAKLLGAQAVLLITSILGEDALRAYIRICDRLGISALVEAHDERELDAALRCGARIIGVNNRNLNDFSVDPDNSRRLRERVPRDIVFVSESGVKTPEDVETIRRMGADAVLIGEALMTAEDKGARLAELRGVK